MSDKDEEEVIIQKAIDLKYPVKKAPLTNLGMGGKMLEERNKLKAQGDAITYKALQRRKLLNRPMRRAISLLSDFINDWPMEYIAHQCGVSTLTLVRWRQMPEFIAALDVKITERKTMLRREAYRQLFRKIRKGDNKMIITYFKMTGDLSHNPDDAKATNNVDSMKEVEVDDAIREVAKELGIDVIGEAETSH